MRDGKTQKLRSRDRRQTHRVLLSGLLCRLGPVVIQTTAERNTQPLRVEQATVLFLVYKLHFDRIGDNAVIDHPAWGVVWSLLMSGMNSNICRSITG